MPETTLGKAREMEIINQVLSVLFVLSLLGGTLWWLRRKGPVRFGIRGRRKAAGARLEAVDRLPLTAQHALHLVRVADRAVLVAVHGAGCTMLESRPWDEVAATGSSPETAIRGVGR
ncbi:MAG: hypothetical protein GY953_54185 [bacterium]|nr:hypothetical protein [bacterium]